MAAAPAVDDLARESPAAAAQALVAEIAELLAGLPAALETDLEAAEALQEAVFERAYAALQEIGGAAALAELGAHFEHSGLFVGSDWAAPEALQAGLVEHSLRSPAGVGVECCSQLRLLAIVSGDLAHPKVAPEEARGFLERVLAFNLDSLFPARPGPELAAAPIEPLAVRRLFAYIVAELGVDAVVARLVVEAERVLITRPIRIHRVRRMIDTAASSLAAWGGSELAREAALLVDALHGCTPLARACSEHADYAAALAELDAPALLLEADTMSTYLRRTGLVSPHHALLVRFACSRDAALLERALGLEAVGRCGLRIHAELVAELVATAIAPATAQAVYGLAELLERGLLFQPPVAAGLRALLDCPIRDEVAAALAAGAEPAGESSPPPARALLVAGALNVLGLPRGVDQGDHPTCQSARAISLWSQVDPAYLLHLVVQAARDGDVAMDFEGERLHSCELSAGLLTERHPELDAVSRVLTPHLDRLYAEMSRRVLDRDDDEHRWVNPAFHGWWVLRDFAALIDEDSGAIHAPEDFVRRFYAAYHPDYAGGSCPPVPQPCGLAITNLAGVFLDWHAVSIQRVAADPHGNVRVYFFNPNHDKGQDWGQGVVTATCDHGEVMGESSLPFADFAARVYVFHFDAHRLGATEAVPEEDVAAVVAAIRASWGASFAWSDEPEPSAAGERA